MGSWLTSILQGVGRTGSELQEAKTANQQEMERRQQLQRQTQMFAAQLQELQQRISGQKTEQSLKTAEGARAYLKGILGRDPTNEEVQRYLGIAPPTAKSKYTDLKPDDKGQMWGLNTETGRFEKVPGGEAFGGAPKEDLETKWAEAQKIATGKFPNDPKKAFEFARSLMPGGASVTKIMFPSGVVGGTTQETIDSLADSVIQGMPLNQVVAGKEGKVKTAVEVALRKKGYLFPREATTQNKNTIASIDQFLPTLNTLEDALSQTDPSTGKPLRENNSVTAAARQRIQWFNYKHLGIKPSDPLLDAILGYSAFTQIAGTTPWMRAGRGVRILEIIQQHLPNPEKDTPANMASKLARLKKLLADQRKALAVVTFGGISKNGKITPIEEGTGPEASDENGGEDVITVTPEDLK